MIVGIAQLTFHFSHCHSLKEKRQQIQKIKKRTLNKFPISIAEISENNISPQYLKGGRGQRGTLGLALVGTDRRYVNSVMDKVINFIQELYLGEIIDRQIEYISF